MNGRLILNYPQSTIFGQTFTLQQNFFGLEFWDDREAKRDTEEILNTVEGDDNSTAIEAPEENLQNHVSNMKAVKMVVMQLRAEHDPTWTNEEVKQYEMDIVKGFEQ